MTHRRRLTVVSYLAPNWFWFYEAVTTYLKRVLHVEIDITQGQCDPLEDPLLLQDQLDIAFICGLPFIRHHQIASHQFQALVAPIMRSPRYQARSIYFSDVIVHSASNLKTFADLAGKTFCYNDPGSNSGYNLLYQHLRQENHSWSFFGRTVQSGSHQQSIQWVVHGLADCAAIDSTVLEQELQDSPQLASQLRVIEVIGPSPMPPIVASNHLGPEVINQIKTALLHPDQQLREAMDRANILDYAVVKLDDFVPLGQSFQVV